MTIEMDVLSNKDLCAKAIDFTGLLSKGQKEILKYLLLFDYDRGVTSDTIQKKAGLTRQAIAIQLRKLMDLEFITRKKSRVYVYSINLKQLHNIVEDYNIANNT